MDRSFFKGFWAVFGAFVIWGLFPLYWHQLKQVPSMQIVAHRVVWCGILVVGYLLLRHGSGWLLFDGIVCLILAIMIWRSWPTSSVWVLGTLVGISLLFTGFSRLMLTLTARRVLATA